MKAKTVQKITSLAILFISVLSIVAFGWTVLFKDERPLIWIVGGFVGLSTLLSVGILMFTLIMAVKDAFKKEGRG